MKLLEERIRKDGVVKPGNVLKVDSFLNHQMDVIFFNEMAKEFKRLYEGVPINKILTIEASGIGIAIMAGLHLEVPVVFAKKSRSSNISDQVYHTVIHSYTHNNDNDVVVSKQYLNEDDHILIIDDFAGRAHRSGASGQCDGGRHRHRGGKRIPGRRRPAAQGWLPGGIAGHRGQHGSGNGRNYIPQQ